VNLHTASNPNGELRGQIDDSTECPTAPATVGVFDQVQQVSGLVYPNPASSELHVMLPLTAKSATVRIIDLRGVEVLNTNITANQTIDVSTMRTGMYTVLVQANNNSYTDRIIIR